MVPTEAASICAAAGIGLRCHAFVGGQKPLAKEFPGAVDRQPARLERLFKLTQRHRMHRLTRERLVRRSFAHFRERVLAVLQPSGFQRWPNM